MVAVAEMAEVAEVKTARVDRVGIGWRGELAAGIFANLAHIDLLEIIADDHFRATPQELRALKTLAAHTPITLHGVAMGLAGSEATETRRMDSMARLVQVLAPESWSEHLAFVRSGGIEIGHLAAPPRTASSVDAAIANIERASQIVGVRPQLENIATLIAPPGSTLDEAAWVGQIVEGADADLLIDLHNLYANAVNFGADPTVLLRSFPLHRVSAVHLSGGKWIAEPNPNPRKRQRLLDDHLHDVPPAVFSLLSQLAEWAPQPLDVIIERDGAYPDFARFLTQLDSARAALREGRGRRLHPQGALPLAA